MPCPRATLSLSDYLPITKMVAASHAARYNLNCSGVGVIPAPAAPHIGVQPCPLPTTSQTALLVAVVLGAAFVPPQLASGAWSYDGTAGTITDGNWTLKVSGSSTNLTLTGYVAGQGDLDLSSLSTDTNRTVVQIGYAVFSGNASITRFVGPDVTVIGGSAFNACKTITNIQVSASMTSIGSYAFCNASALVNIEPTTMPQLTSISRCAFYYASSLVGDWHLPSLKRFTFDAGYSGLFPGTKITSMVATNATWIGDSAFENCWP
jgi:hypothetical protein